MKANKIIEYLETYFPISLQEPWDKCGLQIGDTNQNIDKVMIALNADAETIEKAITKGCTMLITHHPFLLETINVIDIHTSQGKCIQLAMQHNLLVYSLHTCLDQGQNGISMNDWLLQLFDIKDIECYDDIKIGKKGVLKTPLLIEDLATKIKNIFGLSHIKYASKSDKVITSIAICGGSGADDIETLVNQVDAFITGDTKYRHAKYALDYDIALIDVPHHVEAIMEQEVAKLLKQLDVEVILANSKDYYRYM